MKNNNHLVLEPDAIDNQQIRKPYKIIEIVKSATIAGFTFPVNLIGLEPN